MMKYTAPALLLATSFCFGAEKDKFQEELSQTAGKLTEASISASSDSYNYYTPASEKEHEIVRRSKAMELAATNSEQDPDNKDKQYEFIKANYEASSYCYQLDKEETLEVKKLRHAYQLKVPRQYLMDSQIQIFLTEIAHVDQSRLPLQERLVNSNKAERDFQELRYRLPSKDFTELSSLLKNPQWVANNQDYINQFISLQEKIEEGEKHFLKDIKLRKISIEKIKKLSDDIQKRLTELRK